MAPRARSIARGYVKVSEIHHRDAGPEDGFPDKTSDDRIKEISSSFGSITRLLLTKTSGTIAAIATLTFAACSSQPNLTPAQKGGRRIRRDEFRSRRQVLAHRAHLYRCPAIDKPLCSVEYSRPISSACVSVPRAMSSLQKLNGNRYDYPAEIALAIMFGWPKISVC